MYTESPQSACSTNAVTIPLCLLAFCIALMYILIGIQFTDKTNYVIIIIDFTHIGGTWKMYERMLNKQIEPSFEDLLAFSGECGMLWNGLDEWLKSEYSAQTKIRFPYGKDYGWSVKYSKGSKHICDVFAEKGAFNVFLKISDKAFVAIQECLSDYSKEIYADKYPCGDGGWIRYRVTSEQHIDDAKKFIDAKVKIR